VIQTAATKDGASRLVIATAVTQNKCASRAVVNGFQLKAAKKNLAVTLFLPNLLYRKRLLNLSRLQTLSSIRLNAISQLVFPRK
jgi:hypothetical protein